jgi:MYXO-CTERM domain-containing protein
MRTPIEVTLELTPCHGRGSQHRSVDGGAALVGLALALAAARRRRAA